MKKIIFEFQKGGEIIADFLESSAPKTISALIETFPLKSTLYHTRWCGREIYTPLNSDCSIDRENQTSIVNTGDVTYWSDWGKKNSPEAISLYYGAEQVRYITGPLQVNVFARISQDQWKIIEEIGERVWKNGIEDVLVRLD